MITCIDQDRLPYLEETMFAIFDQDKLPNSVYREYCEVLGRLYTEHQDLGIPEGDRNIPGEIPEEGSIDFHRVRELSLSAPLSLSASFEIFETTQDFQPVHTRLVRMFCLDCQRRVMEITKTAVDRCAQAQFSAESLEQEREAAYLRLREVVRLPKNIGSDAFVGICYALLGMTYLHSFARDLLERYTGQNKNYFPDGYPSSSYQGMELEQGVEFLFIWHGSLRRFCWDEKKILSLRRWRIAVDPRSIPKKVKRSPTKKGELIFIERENLVWVLHSVSPK